MRFASLEVFVYLLSLVINLDFSAMHIDILPSHVVIRLMKVSGFVCVQFYVYLGVIESLFRVMLSFALYLTN